MAQFWDGVLQVLFSIILNYYTFIKLRAREASWNWCELIEFLLVQ
jgi:hypothetical protein